MKRMHTDARVATDDPIRVHAANRWQILVHRMSFAGLDEPVVIDIELGAAGVSWIGDLFLHMPPHGIDWLVGRRIAGMGLPMALNALLLTIAKPSAK